MDTGLRLDRRASVGRHRVTSRDLLWVPIRRLPAVSSKYRSHPKSALQLASQSHKIAGAHRIGIALVEARAAVAAEDHAPLGGAH